MFKNISFPVINSVSVRVVRQSAVILAILAVSLVSTKKSYAITPWYAAGGAHTLTLVQDGSVWAVGSNKFGQLGSGWADAHSDEPIRVYGLEEVKSIAAGISHSVALKKDGTVWTWGSNDKGQLGDGTLNNREQPTAIAGLKNVEAVAAGNAHVLVLKKDGTVWGWGSNNLGQLAVAATKSIAKPLHIAGLKDVVAIAAGAMHSTILKKDGTVWAFGYNGSGQLGDGSTEFNSMAPVKIAELDEIIAITGGHHHTLALRRDGTAWGWGSNSYGQLGNGRVNEKSASPIQISSLSEVKDLTAAANRSFAVLKDGTVKVWGDKLSDLPNSCSTLACSDVPVMLRNARGVATAAAIGNPETVIDHNRNHLVDRDNQRIGRMLALQMPNSP
jgi:alpha-tubulin suppressor-like RCC1 family protein